MNDILRKLQAWYSAQCNEEWEHQYGISICTLDNPGWTIDIDLHGTSLDNATFPEVKENYASDKDWVICHIENNVFKGRGGPAMLERMLEIFLTYANSNF